MYDIIAAILSSHASFTVVTLDNRGIGRSAAPAALRLSSGYTVANLAHDAWAVLDHVIAANRLSRAVGLVGHSMGGMIAQHMAYLRPRAVRFLGLLATHAGGVRNLFPSLGMLLAGCTLLYNGFDPAVHADVNLRLHFTDRFLEQVVGGNLSFGDERSGRGDTENGAYSTPPPSPEDRPSLSSPDLSTPTETPMDAPDSELVRTLSGTDLRFLQSKLHQFTHEAGLHFNLSPEHLTRTLREQHKQLIGRLKTLSRTTRREAYHAQYTAPSEGGGSLIDGAVGHARVVWSHSLSWGFARGLRRCQRVVKLVVLGRHDRVVTPDASRRLARLIDATTVVEVDAAHFVTDECVAEVTTQLLFGLRTAFFGGRRCDCPWCGEDTRDECRMC